MMYDAGRVAYDVCAAKIHYISYIIHKLLLIPPNPRIQIIGALAADGFSDIGIVD